MNREQILAFREGLPIFEYKKKIQEKVSENDFVIVTGDTGSGKSTQLPQYSMDSELIRDSIRSKQSLVQEYAKKQVPLIDKINVIITQPRRMAAVSMASRVAGERDCQVGKEVGYTIRFDDKTCPRTQLRYITDGIFVRQCVADPYLFRYHVVILDEAHQRSLYTDILFALVKKAVQYRKGTLKLIVTSATLNTRTFSNYYNKCPVIQMHGKLFPVEVKYYPIRQSVRVEEAVKATIRMHLHQADGDILVFLTGSEECEAATRLCEQKLEDLMSRGRQVPGMIMYQLYGALSNQDQARVFERTPEGVRKVVFCTNIAQTSLTIDNIGFVIDCGFVKQKTFNPKTNMDSLVSTPISKVQAIQRKGRAGRTQEGKCLRLYSEKFYEQMKDYSLPQILRVSLSNVMLTLKSMLIRDVINFEYMQNPDKQAIFKALSDLYLLGALDSDGNITQLGKQMSNFPLQPQFSKALLTAALFDIPDRMITLVSLLSTESVWKKVLRINEEEYKDFMNKSQQFLNQLGDHQTLLNIYQGWTKCEDPNAYCDENFLNFRALRQADNISLQLHEILDQCNFDAVSRHFSGDPNYKEYLQVKQLYHKIPPQYAQTLLRRCLSIAFYYSTARLSANGQAYVLNYPEGTVALLDPTSALGMLGKDAQYLLYTQLGGSSTHGVMRMVSVISNKWITPYLPNITTLDVFRLSGMEVQRSRQLEPTIQETEEEKVKRIQMERELKIREATERYMARKRLKVD